MSASEEKLEQWQIDFVDVTLESMRIMNFVAPMPPDQEMAMKQQMYMFVRGIPLDDLRYGLTLSRDNIQRILDLMPPSISQYTEQAGDDNSRHQRSPVEEGDDYRDDGVGEEYISGQSD